MKHQLLSERRFFGEFLGAPEPPPAEILSQGGSPKEYAKRMYELAFPRRAFFAAQNEEWWLERVAFLTSCANESGYFGGECYTPPIIGRKWPSIFACSTELYLQLTGLQQMSHGGAPTPL